MGASASSVCAPGGQAQELVQVWDGSFVFLSLVISTIGAFTSLTSVAYAFAVLRQPHLRAAFHAYMLASGVALGGVAVWAMHFVGMHALELQTCDGQPVHKTYNVALTITSLVAAIAIGTLVFYLVVPAHSVAPSASAGGSAAWRKRGTEHISASQYWSADLEVCGVRPRVGKFAIGRFALASVLLATGACVMHYMGMTAMYGAYTISFDASLVVVSVLIALVAASAGLFIVVQIAYAGLTWFSLALRVAASLVIALAVNSMHNVGMLSAHFRPTASPAENVNHHLGPNLRMHALIVVAISLSYCFAQLVCTFSHLASFLESDHQQRDLMAAPGSNNLTAASATSSGHSSGVAAKDHETDGPSAA